MKEQGEVYGRDEMMYLQLKHKMNILIEPSVFPYLYGFL